MSCLSKHRNGTLISWSHGGVRPPPKALTPCLHLPNWDQPFIVHSDWSKGAIGAVLSQLDPETGLEHPIHFASRSLSAAERNYAPTEGECLALVWAVQKFRTYLHGHRFVVHTDHASLQWLNNARFTNSKLERWALRLQEHDFTVAYKKGSENLVADALSRFVSAHALQSVLWTTLWPALHQWIRLHKSTSMLSPAQFAKILTPHTSSSWLITS